MEPEARFRALFEEMYPAVARYAHRRGYRGADAEDLIATTFEIAWRRLDKVPEGEAALAWLLSVTRNLTRNLWRRASSERALLERLEAAESSSAACRHAAEDRDADLERRRAVDAAIARLKPIDRELVLLVAWDELTPSQAGQMLGLRPAAARSRLHRARKRLATQLSSDAHGDGPRWQGRGQTPTNTATILQEDAR